MSKELAIIDLIARQTGQNKALTDDAFWEPENRLIYTTDMLVEGRHFDLAYFTPQDLGWKAAAVNVSDIAATGGRPKYLLISLGLPDSCDLAWVHALYEGFVAVCDHFGGQIIGGDTVSSGCVVINVTAVGECPLGHTPGHRYNAQAGDYVIATGYHGLSRVGLLALQKQLPGYENCKMAHLRPMPRIDAGLLLSRQFDRYALMDSSDGLADALLKIAQASGKTLVVEQSAIPVHPELLQFAEAQGLDDQQLWQTILYGGEDFELVATVPSLNAEIHQHFHVLGRVQENVQEEVPATDHQPGVWMKLANSDELKPLSLRETYQHFHGNPGE